MRPSRRLATRLQDERLKLYRRVAPGRSLLMALRIERRAELDALRGLFLVWMTLTHLPTRFSDFVNSPIGFVSSAEGFVFISALLLGRISMREFNENASGVRVRLWKRSLKIYGYHLVMLALAFTVVAALALGTHKAAISNLLDFYLAHPFVAITGSVLLLYCPPLLDILPMYVTFLFFTPLILSAATRFGWRRILIASGAIWLLAQFGLRDLVHNGIVHLTHLQIPLQETGAFNLFAWQAIWILGLWLGARSAFGEPMLDRIPGWLAAFSCAACLFFVCVRYGWLGPHLTQPALGLELDKWQIGPLRAVNMSLSSSFSIRCAASCDGSQSNRFSPLARPRSRYFAPTSPLSSSASSFWLAMWAMTLTRPSNNCTASLQLCFWRLHSQRSFWWRRTRSASIAPVAASHPIRAHSRIQSRHFPRRRSRSRRFRRTSNVA